ncbi:error-prone DNA polymerase [Chondromyces apiculatus]|uniref:Error-prone DNA polymerase n=1 Tax=Chondromyces apiculatus DSM 436 TaxID=1192034 RepID=A0A017SXQ1_9BACT|nr:error-prone DNA polymerase [Chondromyces apiculatus]EYF01774.1 DNA polymerase III alpha subunit [Chondromyces apiculatus DSM 436]
MSTPFAELLGRSSFSFLEGASHPEELCERASEIGLSAFALCDRDGLYGSVRAHSAAKKVNQRVIVGAELTIELPAEAGLTPAPAGPGGVVPTPTVALLVEDHDGYSNLCKLLTAAHAEHEKGTAGISPEAIAASASGLTAVVPLDPRVPVAQWEAVLGPVREAFGERAHVATWRRLDGRDPARAAAAREASARFGVQVVASARPLYHHPSRKPVADVLACIRRGTTLDQAGTLLAANGEASLRAPAQMAALFREEPSWVMRTLDVAERCRFSLSELRYSFPSDTLCLPGESADEALRRHTMEGCKERYPEGTPEGVRAQIEKELLLIQKLGVAPYFLSVQEIVKMARARRVLCQGRGSAANSAVCFVLGVTAVDPARSNLLFERFLSEERNEPPDIDVDFEHERREEVIQDIYARYGRERAAMVSEVISYRGKSALREVGKVFGLSQDQLDRLSGLSTYHEIEVSERRVAEAGLDPHDGRVRQTVLMAQAIEGFPRHLSIHVGGFVLSSEALHRVAPIEPARMEGRTVIPWDKDDLDDLGFFKIDVLGLGMLTAIRKTLGLVHARAMEPLGAALAARGEFDPILALAEVPPEDPEVYEAIGHADTVGVFQIESRAQMAMLPRLKPKTFYDLVIEVAIVRPGPIQGGMVHPYLRRRTGEEAPVSPHPCLDPILDRTLGVPMFQEQVMQIAMVGAGYTPGEADQLRRDMAAWKKHGRLSRHRERLLRGFAERGISARFGEMLYQQVQGFGEYGFPESHAASFALLVYASSWLKVHHPAAFVCALLNSQPMGFYSPSALVQDAQRHGVEVRTVCVVRSDWDCTLEEAAGEEATAEEEATAGEEATAEERGAEATGARDAKGQGRRVNGEGTPQPAMRLGMRLIKGFGEAAGRAVVVARAEGPFTSLEDLVRRAGLKKNEIEALAEAGALGELVPARREALWQARAPRLEGLFEGVPLEAGKDVGLPALAPIEQLSLDYGRVGLSVDDHPMRHLRAMLKRRRVRRAEELPKMRDGESVRIAGIVTGRQRPATASGVTFVTLEDETGSVNVIVQKQLFADSYQVARHAKIMLVVGRLERQGEVVHVLARELERLDMPGGGGLPAKSRDFH